MSPTKSLRGQSRADWPQSFRVAWDLAPANFHLAYDGMQPSEFKPSEYLLGEADLAEIDDKLHGASRRSSSELWTFAPEKVERVIQHWSNGGLITPPLLDVNMGCLVIAGGFNRMAVCRADGVIRIPFLHLRSKLDLFKAKLETYQ